MIASQDLTVKPLSFFLLFRRGQVRETLAENRQGNDSSGVDLKSLVLVESGRSGDQHNLSS
jgi:hypothetical protein